MTVLHVDDRAVVLQLRGDHDLCTRLELRSLLEDLVAANALVVVDLTQAGFVDSTFLDNLTHAHKTACAGGCRLVVQTGQSPSVATALRVSGLLQYLDCVDTREHAISRR